jgi:hypothetical protein
MIDFRIVADCNDAWLSNWTKKKERKVFGLRFSVNILSTMLDLLK